MDSRKQPVKDTEWPSEAAIITIDSLPPDLKAEFDQAVDQYYQQADLQKRVPNHVQYRQAMRAAARQLQVHIEALTQIRNRYAEEDQFAFGEETGPIMRDEGLPEGDYDVIPEFTPVEILDRLVKEANEQLHEVKINLEGLPQRKGGKRKDGAANLFFSRMIKIYKQAGGTPKLHLDVWHNPRPNAFWNFMEDTTDLIDYTTQSNRAFADLLTSLIPPTLSK